MDIILINREDYEKKAGADDESSAPSADDYIIDVDNKTRFSYQEGY
jgi:hypothetical protein